MKLSQCFTTWKNYILKKKINLTWPGLALDREHQPNDLYKDAKKAFKNQSP